MRRRPESTPRCTWPSPTCCRRGPTRTRRLQRPDHTTMCSKAAGSMQCRETPPRSLEPSTNGVTVAWPSSWRWMASLRPSALPRSWPKRALACRLCLLWTEPLRRCSPQGSTAGSWRRPSASASSGSRRSRAVDAPIAGPDPPLRLRWRMATATSHPVPSSCTGITASGGSKDWCTARWPAWSATTCSLHTTATIGCTSPPTSWLPSAPMWAGRRPGCRAWAAPTGRRPEPKCARPSK